MKLDDSNWTYNEFLAFLMVYAAEMNMELSIEELEFIRSRTGIESITGIKAKVNSVSDAEAIEIVEDYRTRYLETPEQKQKVRHDLEDLLKAQNSPNQLEKVVVHILERII
jgi:transcription antitermination factor NusG